MKVALLSIVLAICGVVLPVSAQALQSYQLNVARQPLDAALKDLAHQTGLQIARFSDTPGGSAVVGPISGQMSAEQALASLLTSSGLTYKRVNDTTIAVMTVGDAAKITPATVLTQSQGSGAGAAAEIAKEGKTSSSGEFRVAQAAAAAPASVAPLEQKAARITEPSVLQEVIVTAQKREERLIDTPQSVSVLSSEDLAKLGATQFRDFANTVPGLDFNTSGAGSTQIAIRGVTAGFDVSSTVGIYVDDVPYGTNGAFSQAGQNTIDVGLFDVARIEILRGPQGTLYGASTMGGLIQYVTKQPDTTGFSGSARLGVSGTADGGINYEAASALNIPLVTGKAAVRVSGYESHDGGYIDNVATGRQDVNRSNTYGGRVDLLLTPSDPLSIRINAFAQNISRDGEATADYTYAGAPAYGGSLDQYRKLSEPFDQKFRLVSARISYDFGPTTLTSISSFQTVRVDYVSDISENYVQYCAYVLLTCGAVGYPVELGTDNFTQELRLGSRSGGVLEWLVGAFFTHEKSTNQQVFSLFDPAGQPLPSLLFNFSEPSTYQESAAFGDLTWHLNSKFDVTGGIRYAHNNQESTQYGSGLFIGTFPTASSSDGVFTYLANARYHFGEHATGYLRYATGYRPGGPNFIETDPTTGLPNGPATFKPDRLQSYEAGFKSETTDGRFGLDVAVYSINWSDIQLAVVRGGLGAIANAPGGATVRGSELTLSLRPVHELTLTGAFAYQNAYLKEANPDLGAAEGERLPNVPRFTAALNADYEISNGGWRPTVGATFRHVSDRFTSFDQSLSFPQYHLPEYSVFDLRTGLTLGSVEMQFYAHNLFDERGQLGVLWPQFGNRVAILQPRTIGVSASAQF